MYDDCHILSNDCSLYNQNYYADILILLMAHSAGGGVEYTD